jgi:hypothetical protein
LDLFKIGAKDDVALIPYPIPWENGEVASVDSCICELDFLDFPEIVGNLS